MLVTYCVAFFCTLGMAFGQILFKASANASQADGSPLSFQPLALLCGAMFLYGITSLAWVWVLQRIPLGKVYPFMALAFVFVPIGTYFIFDEHFEPQYVFGVAFIIAGVFLTTTA